MQELYSKSEDCFELYKNLRRKMGNKIEYYKNNRYYYKTLALDVILNKEKRVFENITNIQYLGA